MDSPLKFLVVMLTVQLFFSAGVNIFTYSLPDAQKTYAYSYGEIGEQINANNITNEVQNSITRQTNIPLIDAGALLFYSGNILLDLFMNFFLAIPEMVTLLFNGMAELFSLDLYINHTMQLFVTTLIILFYFIGVIQMIIGIRTGKTVI